MAAISLFSTGPNSVFLPGMRVASAQTASCERSVIRAPFTGDTLSGTVTIFGSAEIGSFIFYKLEWATQNNPEVWSAVSSIIEQPVRNGVLDRWDTRNVPDDLYRLKLTVVDDGHQEVCRFTSERLTVRNAASVPAAEGASATPGTDTPPQRETPLPTAPRAGIIVAEATSPPEPVEPTAPLAATPSPLPTEALKEPTAKVSTAIATEPVATETPEPAEPPTATNESDVGADETGDQAPADGAEGDPTVVSRADPANAAGEDATSASDVDAADDAEDVPSGANRLEGAAQALGLGDALRAFTIGFVLVLALAAVAWRIGARRSDEA